MKAFTVCALCALKAFVKGEPYNPEHESPAAHLHRVHPDPEVARAEHDRLMPLAEERAAELARGSKLADMRERNEFN